MEILSTGEKIKRSRIYKGITLKELCGSKISISKMSCIENGKVKADENILRYISKKLEVEFDYLISDTYEQINENISKVKRDNKKSDNFEKDINNNLKYSLEYGYLDLAFELTHILFNYYLDIDAIEEEQTTLSNYYDIYQRLNTENNNEINTIVYFKDIAKYLFKSKEYFEALIYYGRIIEIIEDNNKGKVIAEYLEMKYKEALCYSKLNEIDKAYNIIKYIISKEDLIDDLAHLGEIYKEYALICIRKKLYEANDYIERVIKSESNSPYQIAKFRGEYGKAFFEVGQKEKGIREIIEAVNIFPKDNNKEYVNFLSYCIRILFDNKVYDESYKLTDEALNLAIVCNDIKLIESIYYYKGSILQKKGKYKEAERFMNLSLDSLFKFVSKEKRYNRYIEMGMLYYNLSDIKESIKYFTLANKIEENNEKQL